MHHIRPPQGFSQDSRQRLGIGLRKGVGLIAVDVEHPDQGARAVEHRQDQFRLCWNWHKQYARETHRHWAPTGQHASAPQPRRPPAGQMDHQTAMPALIRPDFNTPGAVT